MNRFTAVMILLSLAECLLFAALFLPTPPPSQIVRTIFNTGMGPVYTQQTMQWFGMFVACPLIIWACYLLDHE